MKVFVPALAAVLAGSILAACDGKPAEPPRNLAAVTAGFDAFKAGDQVTLERQIQALDALLPADRTGGVFVACSEEGYAARRVAKAKQRLEILDRSPIFSMSDTAKYVYFQHLVAGGDLKIRTGDVGGPTDFECERTDNHDETMRRDSEEFYAIRDVGRDRMRAWFTALRTSLGADFEPQMKDAAKSLHSYGLSDIDRWEAPNSI